jgi:hypothetical protein
LHWPLNSLEMITKTVNGIKRYDWIKLFKEIWGQYMVLSCKFFNFNVFYLTQHFISFTSQFFLLQEIVIPSNFSFSVSVSHVFTMVTKFIEASTLFNYCKLVFTHFFIKFFLYYKNNVITELKWVQMQAQNASHFEDQYFFLYGP